MKRTHQPHSQVHKWRDFGNARRKLARERALAASVEAMAHAIVEDGAGLPKALKG